MSKRSGNSRRSTRSKRRERREVEKEERLLHIFARFSIATIALYRKGNRWISGLIKSSSSRSCSLSRPENSGSDFSSREEISLSTMSVRSLGSFSFFFLSSYFPRVYIGFYVGKKTEKIANLSRRNPLRMADISAGERRRRIWRVLDRSVFSFSPLPLPYEAVE